MFYPVPVQSCIVRRDFIAAVTIAEEIPDLDPQARSLLRVLATLQFEGGALYQRAVELFECPNAAFWLHAGDIAQEGLFSLTSATDRSRLLDIILAVLYEPAPGTVCLH